MGGRDIWRRGRAFCEEKLVRYAFGGTACFFYARRVGCARGRV